MLLIRSGHVQIHVHACSAEKLLCLLLKPNLSEFRWSYGHDLSTAVNDTRFDIIALNIHMGREGERRGEGA